LAFEAAKAVDGRFLLRIEDIDTTRSRSEHVQAIFQDLAWLGLTWEEPVVFQTSRGEAYRAALEALISRGLVYRCFRTRAEIAEIASAPHGSETPFFGEPLTAAEETRRLGAGEPFAWRLSVRAAEAALGGFGGLTFVDDVRGEMIADPWSAGDIILARKDVGVSYHLAVTVDDAWQGVNLVVRGEDLLQACHVQRLLQALLDLPTPIYRHHRLILRPDGKRFAKRDAAETLRGLRAAGVTADRLKADLLVESRSAGVPPALGRR
jgi:glutamyl-Q tRNA(Asp) synthetase